jgi:hypothetical protein
MFLFKKVFYPFKLITIQPQTLIMNARLIYLIVFIALFLLAIVLQKKYGIINDTSSTKPKSYSYSRLQLLWWTFIVFASFITIALATGQIPDLDTSTLILLGIGSLTTASARITDISDQSNYDAATQTAETTSTPPPATLSKDQPSEGFLLDILSDKNGVSIHRLQAFMFNLIFGIWFIYQSVYHLKGIGPKATAAIIDHIIPVISNNNLILLGLSAGTYVALKTTENK